MARGWNAYAHLTDDAEGCGASAAATHLRAAQGEVLRTCTQPTAGRLRVRRQGPPRTRHRRAGTSHAGDEPPHRRGRAVERRGRAAMLMVKLERKYAHGRWSPP